MRHETKRAWSRQKAGNSGFTQDQNKTPNNDMGTTQALPVRYSPPGAALELFPDSARYKARFTIKSESSNTKYMVSFDAAPGAMYWTCSCPGNLRWGQCKHLTAMGLKGRQFGRQIGEAKKYGWLS